jgi:ABC-type uncharacterized transport system substrate-binding protein
MIRRRHFLQAGATALVLASARPALGWPSAPVARLPRDRPRLGMLGESNPFAWVFHDPDVEVVCRWADARELGRRADELAALEVDLIVAAGVGAARAAVAQGAGIPVVFVVNEDVDVELRRRATGLRIPSDAELCARRLTLLRRARPRLMRLGVLHNPDNPLHGPAVAQTRRLAGRAGLALDAAAADRADRLDRALTELRAAGAEGLVVLPDALFSLHAERLVAQATALSLLGLYPAPSFVRAGGLMALHGDMAAVVDRLGAIVRRIAAGAPVASIPVQRAEGLTLTVNAGAAVALAAPPALLRAADTVITSGPVS